MDKCAFCNKKRKNDNNNLQNDDFSEEIHSFSCKLKMKKWLFFHVNFGKDGANEKTTLEGL